MTVKSLLIAAGFAGASLIAGAASAAVVDFDFVDSNHDVVDLVLQTAGPVQPTGTALTSITGSFNGLAINKTVFAGSDNIIYGSGALVDYPGIAFVTSTNVDYNLYWTNSTRGATPGGYGLCYVASCNQSTGFYTLTVVPEPAAWAMMLIGFGGVGVMARSRRGQVTAPR